MPVDNDGARCSEKEHADRSRDEVARGHEHDFTAFFGNRQVDLAFELAVGKHRNDDDDGFDENRPDGPPDNGFPGVFGGFRAVKFLVHALNSHEQYHGGKKITYCLCTWIFAE